MTPFDFEVTGSKVKVTGTLTLKVCPPNNLRNLLPTVFIFGIGVDFD
jgi:hypothetical protein